MTILVVLLSVVLVAEVAVRALAERLPRPLVSDFDVFLQQSLDDVDRLSSSGGADVLFVGSSVAGYAIDPALFTERSRAASSAYNAWLPGAGLRVLRAYTDEILLGKLSPAVVVIAVTSRELNDKGATSPELPAGTQYGDSAVRHGAIEDGRLLDRAGRWASERSYLVRYRQRLREPAQVLRYALGARAPDEPVLRTPLGHINAAGRRIQKIDENYLMQERDALSSFSVDGAEFRALELLIDELRSKDIVPIVAGLPVATEHLALHPSGAADQARYERALDALVAETDVDFITFPRQQFEGSFVDWNHLDAEGASRLTTQLARQVDRVMRSSQ